MRLRVVPVLCLLFGLARGIAAEPPAAAELVRVHRAAVSALEEGLREQLERIRGEHMRRLGELEAGAIREHKRTLWLWTHSEQERLASLGQNWREAFSDPLDRPAPLAELNARTLLEIDRVRAAARRELDRERADIAAKLGFLWREETRLNRIEQAVAAREAERSVTQDTAPTPLERTLEALAHAGNPARGPYVPRAWNTEQAPPDASFPFTGENPAFLSFVKELRAVSAGHRDGPEARVVLGERLIREGGRGLTVVALVDREVVLSQTYDTYAEAAESDRFVKDIRALPYGAFVVLAVRDDATRRFTGAAQSALFRLGAAEGIRGQPYRSSYLLIGVKGLPPGQGLERGGPGKVAFP